MLSSGIYSIKNTVNGKQYIGSAVTMRYRWNDHKKGLSLGKHANCILQNAWAKYGEKAFVFTPLLVCAKDQLLFYEQRAIDILRPEYNICKIAGSMLGIKHSKPRSIEHRAKISEYTKGNKNWLGRTHSDEAKAKISASKKGKPNGLLGIKRSPETCAKLSVALTGLKRSPEECLKMSARQKGYVPTLETRQKTSVSVKLSWIKRMES